MGNSHCCHSLESRGPSWTEVLASTTRGEWLDYYDRSGVSAMSRDEASVVRCVISGDSKGGFGRKGHRMMF